MSSKSKRKNKPPQNKTSNKKNLLVIFILFAIGFLVFGNTFENKLIWDDEHQIINNVFVQDFDVKKIFSTSLFAGSTGVVSNYYRPLVVLTLAIEYKIWGINPMGFHIVNLLIHILTSVLIYFTILSLWQRRSISFLAALLFLVHPIAVESVTYVATITELLPVCFIVLSVFIFIKFKYAATTRRRVVYYGTSFFVFILAILSKESSVVLPALLIIIHLIFIDRELSRKNIKRILIEIGPFILIATIYTVLRFTILRFDGQATSIGVLSPDILGSLSQFIKALYSYGVILLFPVDLHYRLETSIPITSFDFQIIFVCLVLAAIVYYSIRSFRKIGTLFFGFSWFFIGLLPVSGIFMASDFVVGIRWLRLPSIGLFFLVALLMVHIWDKLANKSAWIRRLLIFMIVIYFIFLGATTFINNRLWKDGVTYFSYLVKYYPNGPGVHLDLAYSLYKEGREAESIVEYSRAADNFEKIIYSGKQYVSTHVYLSKIYIFLGRYEDALRILEKFRETYPDLWQPYFYTGYVLEETGEFHIAKQNYEKALSIDPENSLARSGLKRLEKF